MTDNTVKIYMAAILLHLGLILMALSTIANSVYEYSSTNYDIHMLFGFFSALIAGGLLLRYLVELFSTSGQS